MISLSFRVQCVEKLAAHFGPLPQSWGSADCASLARFVMRECGLPDPIKVAGGYRTERGALRSLRLNGYASLTDAADKHFPRIPAATALPGDLVALPAPAGSPFKAALGVCAGAFAFAWSAEGELDRFPMTEAVAAWRVA